MIRQIFSIRGATTVDRDTAEEVKVRSVELMRAVCETNGLGRDALKVVHYIVGTTADIRSFYPARAIRESGLLDAPVFSCGEPDIEGALPRCIRVLVEVANIGAEEVVPRHVYLHGAVNLRKDLCHE